MIRLAMLLNSLEIIYDHFCLNTYIYGLVSCSMGSLRVDFCRQFVISPVILSSLSLDSNVFSSYYKEGCHVEDLDIDPCSDLVIPEIN